MSPVVVLVGVPGSGKSTVGRRLAELRGSDFADTDDLIVGQEGRPIADIFVDSGEEYFRTVEKKVASDALNSVTGVLSLGGGAILDPDTQELLRDQRVVWLRVSPDTAVRRVGLNLPRPVLLGNVRARMTQMLQDRTAIYERVASAGIVDNDGDDIDATVREVAALVEI